MNTIFNFGAGCTSLFLLKGRQLFLTLTFLFSALTCFSQIPFNLRELLENTQANPVDFRDYAQAYKWKLKNTMVTEGGLLATDTFHLEDMILIKEYGYFAIRSAKGIGIWMNIYKEKNKRRRNKAMAALIQDRDSRWTDWQESSWTSIELYNIPDSIAQKMIAQKSKMNCEEVECCFKPIIKDGEEKRYAINDTYLFLVTSHRRKNGVFYDFHISIPKSPPTE